MDIKPVYVTFEQAKLLREKGFNVPTICFYVIGTSEYGDLKEFIQNPNDNFPSIDDNSLFDTLASAPEQWQVVEWLRINHNIWVQPMLYRRNPNDYIGGIYIKKIDSHFTEPFNSPQEAYSAAFDYVLNNLI